MRCPKCKQGPLYREIRPLRDVCKICGTTIWLDFARVNKVQRGRTGADHAMA